MTTLVQAFPDVATGAVKAMHYIGNADPRNPLLVDIKTQDVPKKLAKKLSKCVSKKEGALLAPRKTCMQVRRTRNQHPFGETQA